MTRRAIVLAAGRGSRLVDGLEPRKGAAKPPPKPLWPVAGRPMIERVLTTAAQAGVTEAVVVIGHRGEALHEILARDHGLTLEVVHNPAADGANGTSLLAARDWITEDCLLLMADHLYPPALLERFRRAEVRRGGCLLAVDARPERCFDLADATKVRRAGDRVVAIGKRLTDYDAVDCGVFRIGPALVEALAQHLAMHGDCAITDGAAALAAEGRLWAEPVGDTPWVDVDTPEALRHAEALLALDDPTIAGVTRHAPAWVRAAAPYDRAHFDDAERAPEAARLMANESPLGPSPAVLAAVAEAAREAHRYPRSSTRLRERLALREGLSAERVIVGAGSAELIDLAVRTFVTPGDEAVIVVPSFSLYEARTRVAGGIPRRVPRAPDGELDLDALAAAVTDRTKLLFLCRPNNPTGHCDPAARVEALLELDRPTVIDEAYLAPDDPRSLRRLLDRYDHLILLRSFSKVHGLAGLRVGYALASGAAVKLMAAVQLPWSLSAPALAAADAVLDEQEEQARRWAAVVAERERLAAALAELPGLSLVGSEANFVLVEVGGLGARRLCEGMQRRGFHLRTVDGHRAEGELLRITAGSPEDGRRCLEALEALLGEVRGG